jgi:ABC-type antimicrobial peptide transport system ATPase subunit
MSLPRRREIVAQALADTGLDPAAMDRYPHEFSGGQRQRIAIARAWRLLVEEGRKAGHTFSQPDLIIAATALCHGLTILSRDTSDYERAHAPVIDPWR